ncbi:PIN domain-containing protein [Candidatus Lokiarchaeum ossiferum]|uniref:PIN domain-containing protein n=1 Tax=Candidatus Lokiarchaeum ossiferum TaxID=2951803 RepID=UPI00352D142A
MNFFILDTNILLENKFIKHISWQDYSPQQKFTIIIPRTVLKELDKLKFTISPKKKKRIHQVIRYFDDIFENQIENIFNIKLLTKRINWDELFKFKSEWVSELDRNMKDDCILAEILTLQMNNPESQCTLFTGDILMKINAGTLGIQVIDVSKEKQFEKEKSLKNVEKNITDPILEIFFSHNSKILEITSDSTHFKHFSPFSWEEIQKVADYYRNYEKHPKWSKILEENLTTKNYDEYLKKCKDYIKKIDELYNFHPLELYLENSGGAPANNIDLHFTIESKKEVDILNSNEFFQFVDKKPNPPVFPFGPWGILTILFPKYSNLKPHIQKFDPEEFPELTFSDTKFIDNEKNRSIKFSVHVDLLKHGERMEIPTYWMEIPKSLSLNEIHVNYRITQIEPVKPKDDVLIIKIKKPIIDVN